MIGFSLDNPGKRGPRGGTLRGILWVCAAGIIGGPLGAAWAMREMDVERKYYDGL